MPRFSKTSLERLNTCDTKLVQLFSTVINVYDCRIIQGHRDQYEQNEYYRIGKSKVQWPNSQHNSLPSKAVDVAPYPIDWKNTKRFYHFAGFVKGTAEQMGILLRWGGDWDSDYDLDDQIFMDLVHFELVDV
jgi:peptidoglycan L-alanyl-D-glutamate endopeptidase CwlK